MKRIGIADTTFARYDMAKTAIDELHTPLHRIYNHPIYGPRDKGSPRGM